MNGLSILSKDMSICIKKDKVRNINNKIIYFIQSYHVHISNKHSSDSRASLFIVRCLVLPTKPFKILRMLPCHPASSLCILHKSVLWSSATYRFIIWILLAMKTFQRTLPGWGDIWRNLQFCTVLINLPEDTGILAL